jgi:uncharacterized membrane protein
MPTEEAVVELPDRATANNAVNTTEPAQARPRLDSVDLLRGLVMVIMALDHTREFFTNAFFDPTDLTKTNAALFLTRWITHFCAPVFVFLAGTGAFLSTSRGKSKSELSRFLLTRGLWLVLLELTFIRCFGWYLNFNYQYSHGGVIWALGWSMVVLAALVYLPRWAVIAFGVALVAGHNLFDGVKIQSLGAFGWLWAVLHVPAELQVRPNMRFFTQYPLVPWIGVMAVGYGFGAWLQRERAERRKWMLRLGLALTLAFVLLRAINVYGDPHHWSAQQNALFTFFSFLNCEKYPPSLLYLLMTLGPAIAMLALFDRELGAWSRPLVIFGRVPLFYYLLHLPLLRVLVIGWAVVKYGKQVFTLAQDQPPPDWGYSLPVVYLIWLAVVLLLYPACRWFAGVKQRRREAWLSYL